MTRWIRLPGLTQAREYQRSWLRGDVIAGLTVSAYLIPQVMAYAGVAGLPPVAGLWAAAPCLAIYALLGSSRSLSLGPEASTALMTAVAIGPLARSDTARYAALATTLALLVGVLCVLAGLARLGFIADLLSRPVIVGYMAGLAATMIAGQLGKLTGTPVTGRTFLAQLTSFGTNLASVRPATTLLSTGVLAFLFVVAARWPSMPGPLIAVAGATAVVWIFGLASHGVAVVGPVPSGLPPVSLPDLRPGDLRDLIGPAFTVLVMAFTDDVLTARAFVQSGEEIDANAELIALGVANVAAGFVRAFPVSSSASRTAIGRASGSRTQLYSLTAAAVMLAVLGFGHTLLAQFPDAALGAIVIYAAVQLVDVTALRRLVAFRRRELLIAVVACAGVLIVNLLYGVLIAIGISVAELLVRVARPHDAVLGQVPGLAGMHDVEDYPSAETIPGLVVYRYDAPLFFANAEDFRRRALAAAGSQSPVRWFVLNVEANVEVDFTALEALEAVRAELTGRGVVFALARAKQELLARLTSFGLTGRIGNELIFPTLPTAVAAYRQWSRQHPPAD
ncbi:MAG TPA: sulfate permease [Streptosporangiaceae bacterium]|nr:sulfate permease [Streptosporangiaceae bacterium]